MARERREKIRDRREDVFLPDKEHLVRMIAMKGATDDEIAEAFGVDKERFQRWRRIYPSMNTALEQGRLQVDADVVYSAYKSAVGYTYEEEQATQKGGVVTVERYAKADPSSIQYWLNNRQPLNWRSSSTKHLAGRSREDDEAVDGVKPETRDDLINAIVSMIAPKPDGASKASAKDTPIKR